MHSRLQIIRNSENIYHFPVQMCLKRQNIANSKIGAKLDAQFFFYECLRVCRFISSIILQNNIEQEFE